MGNFFNNIRQLRKALKLNQTAFGKKVGYSANRISDFEKNKAPLNDRFLNALVQEFNVSREWIVSGTGPMYIPAPEPAPAAPDTLPTQANSRLEQTLLRSLKSCHQQIKRQQGEIETLTGENHDLRREIEGLLKEIETLAVKKAG